mgnify:FL=1
MNAVGIDVSKGKSTVAVLRPFGEIVVSPFDVSHSPKELLKFVALLKTLNGDTKVVMEYTGNYYLPIAQFLRNNGIFVSVVNPILVKDYSTKSLTVRKVKTDKKDALKIASFALDRWNELSPFSVQSEARLLLKSYNRQYNQYNKLKGMLKNNLISILDQTFPSANTLFSTPARKSDGHEKWVDFVLKYPHSECISKKTFSFFLKSYLSWCRRFGYNFSESKARVVYDFACDCSPSLSFSDGSALLVSNAVSQLNNINETLSSLASEMNKIAASLPEYNTVMSMFGVGSVLGSQLIAEIGDVSRFSNKKALVGFAGLDASPFQSGNFNPQSRPISKRGSAALRKTLFQVMSVVLQRAPTNNALFQFIDKKRSEGKHFYVYMTAAANKFLRIYYARVTEHLNSLKTVA